MKPCIFLTQFVPVFLLVGLAVAEKTCSPVCTMEYKPVCAGDGVTKPIIFANPCGFEYYNCANPDKQLRQLKSSECNLEDTIQAKLGRNYDF